MEISNKTLQIPPHLNGVAALPYEILMSDNIAWHIAGALFYKI